MPRSEQGAGRVDNPEHYGVLYLAATPVAAIAERLQAFGGRRITPAHLRGGRNGMHLALAEIRLGRAAAGDIPDLDHPTGLARHDLIPSDVATRDRTRTQAWARRVWESGFTGVRYWSTIEAKWPITALWRLDALRVERVEALTIFDRSLREAATVLGIDVGGSR